MQYVALEHCTVTLNGTLIEGFAPEADAIMMPEIEIATVTVGPDGLKTFTTTGQRGGEVSLKLQPNSRGGQFLGSQFALELGRQIVVFNGVIQNHHTGYTSRLTNGGFVRGPSGISFGTEVNMLEFVIDFTQIVTLWDGIRTQPVPLSAQAA